MRKLIATVVVFALVLRFTTLIASAGSATHDFKKETMQITVEVLAEQLDEEAVASALDENSAIIVITLGGTSEVDFKLALAKLSLYEEAISLVQIGTEIEVLYVKYITEDYTPLMEFTFRPNNTENKITVMFNPTFTTKLKDMLG